MIPMPRSFQRSKQILPLSKGSSSLQNLLMDSHDFQATGGGTIGFDQRLNLIVNLNLSQEVSQKLAGASPVVKVAMKDGRLSLPANDHRYRASTVLRSRCQRSDRKSAGAGEEEGRRSRRTVCSKARQNRKILNGKGKSCSKDCSADRRRQRKSASTVHSEEIKIYRSSIIPSL